MDSMIKTTTIGNLGDKLRAARLEHRMTQDMLASPEFTKSYVSAVERGKARPSLKALDIMSRKLGLTPSEILGGTRIMADSIDLAAATEELSYQLDSAKHEIDTGHADEALRILNAAEQEHGGRLVQLNKAVQIRIYYLRGLAYLRAEEPGAAQQDLGKAMQLTEKLSGAEEMVERIRNAIGASYFQQNLPQMAREHHDRCFQAIQSGVVKDPNLRLMIYTNLAADYSALDNPEGAISVYKEALGLLGEFAGLESQAGIYWGLSLAYKAADDLGSAKLYSGRALDIYEAVNNLNAAAEISLNMAAIMTQRAEYADAEKALERARALLDCTDNPASMSALHHSYADLELRRKQPESAAKHAAQSLELGSQAYKDRAKRGDAHTRSDTLRTYVQALGLAGRVAESKGDTKTADARFREAIKLAGEAQYWDASGDLAFTYAELLTARNDHAQAGQYYRDAFKHRHARGRA
ncbi:MAG: helix-turn-helix domain-containing protein [Chloroflexia bacterium]